MGDRPLTLTGPAETSVVSDVLSARSQAGMGMRLPGVSRLQRILFDEAVKPFGITRPQWWLLANLTRKPASGMTQTELCDRLEIRKVTVSGIVDRLEARGHVERRLDPVDRRLRRIFLTRRGQALVHRLDSMARDLNEVMLQGVPPADLAVAEEVMGRMKANLRRELAAIRADGAPAGRAQAATIRRHNQ
jgi:DNA-binding MarR family transcriptional regulator